LNNLAAEMISAKALQTDKLCVGDVCVTGGQLKELLDKNGISSSTEDSPPITEDSPPSATSDVGNPDVPLPAIDTEPPILTLQGNNPAIVIVGSVYGDLGVVVTDNVDRNLGYEVWRNGELLGRNLSGVSVDTSIAGEYSIDYVAMDQAGNTATSTRTIIVEEQSPVEQAPLEQPSEPAPAEPAPALESPIVGEPAPESIPMPAGEQPLI